VKLRKMVHGRPSKLATPLRLVLLWLACSAVTTEAWSQDSTPNPAVRVIPSAQALLGRVTCPGDPPGNLASVDCRFTMPMRVAQFFGTSVTDQAVLGAAFSGAVAQIRNSPPEWDRDWDGLGRRIGTRYGQNLVKGAAVLGVDASISLIVGTGTDPRHVSYASDPRINHTQTSGGAWARIGHATMDWATVRLSAVKGDGRRVPNLPLFAGAVASGFTGNLWYPDRLTTLPETAKRVGGSLGTALLASFYNEFQPEIGRVLGRILRRGATSSNATQAATGGVR
jgi:hypothetical protein